MLSSFTLPALRAAYDRGRLVPFIGSGMSRPACTGWPEFVTNLECAARDEKEKPNAQSAELAPPSPSTPQRLTERALQALQTLRRRGANLPAVVRDAIYCKDSDDAIPESSRALAKVHWPLVCTTNYDEIYLRARAAEFRARKLDARQWPRLTVLGRSETDCRLLLQHLSFPAQQVVWALQGFLRPTDKDALLLTDECRSIEQLQEELVIGHSEYRKATHHAPHFRRVFAELYRTRSLLFLGSGLSESYFRSLFDEIIELAGPPERPHHAFVPEGSLDADFMRREYHIACHTYSNADGSHGVLTEWLEELQTYLGSGRVRSKGWSFGLSVPNILESEPAAADFTVVRSGLPKAETLPDIEGVAVSCGRPVRVSGAGARMIGLPPRDRKDYPYVWRSERKWVVEWTELKRSYGIVARSETDDDRTPEAIRESVIAFLDYASQVGLHAVHVQLLAAGKEKVFAPWVSLMQMARAYGDWARRTAGSKRRIRMLVYVVDPGVIALLDGAFLDLTEALEGGGLRINVETIENGRVGSRHHEMVDPEAPLKSLTELATCTNDRPLVYALPQPRRYAAAVACQDVSSFSFREFGLVSGSTLVVDFTAVPGAGDETLR